MASYSGTAALKAGFEHYRTLLDDGQTNKAWYAAGGRLRMPTLAVGGEHAVGSRLAEALRDVAPAVAAGVVPGSGHFVAEENPEALLAVITPFLTGTNGADR
ncbi:alpha/beta fold hydrolase [Micromonospora sp. NPDC093277]|uniref:alpha/beta fold hydrolase n=1 Tax=Micromonospora sp. NPDC093277 TaxID=3364291 RepID=UPI003809AC42